MTHLRRLTNWTWGLVSAVLLFVVVAHAVAPVTQDHGQGRGSAFSASTAEVSLKSGARALVAKEIVRLEPLAPAALVAQAAVTATPPASQVEHDGDRVAHWLPAQMRPGPVGQRAPPAA